MRSTQTDTGTNEGAHRQPRGRLRIVVMRQASGSRRVLLAMSKASLCFQLIPLLHNNSYEIALEMAVRGCPLRGQNITD